MYAGYFCMLSFVAGFFFQNYLFQKNLLRNLSIRVLNCLDPDQDQQKVGPDLDPKLFAKVISRCQKPMLASKELTK